MVPTALKARLFKAFDLEVLWNKPGQQAAVFVEITEATLKAIPGILDPDQDGYHDTDPEEPGSAGDLFNTPICPVLPAGSAVLLLIASPQ